MAYTLCQKNPVSLRLQYFRPGEEARMIARCQFGIEEDGRCGAIMTYPIQGYPWRRNPMRMYEFRIDAECAARIFDEVMHLPANHLDHCLDDSVLWSDHAEKGANAITRDDKTDTPCHTIAIYNDLGEHPVYFSMREDSDVLHDSEFYRTIMGLIAPYEALPQETKAQQASSSNH